jgi:hypothetical protein
MSDASKPSRVATSRSAPATLDDLPLDRGEALHFREQMARRDGFQDGLEVARKMLAEEAADLFLQRDDKAAEKMRDIAERFAGGIQGAVNGRYGDSLSGVDLKACWAMLTEEPKS